MKKVVLVLLVLVGGWWILKDGGGSGELDEFAQCLTEAGAKEYGAFWCPHCNDQKKMFGNSWQYVTYQECSLPNRSQNEICQEAGIESYPTWEFADGYRKQGVMSLQELSEKTGCSLE